MQMCVPYLKLFWAGLHAGFRSSLIEIVITISDIVILREPDGNLGLQRVGSRSVVKV